MIKRALVSAAACTAFLTVLICNCHNALAMSEFLDGDLKVSGFLKETMYYRTAQFDREKQYRDNSFDFAKTSFYIEGLYNITESPDLTMRFFAGFKYWYEASHKFDEKQDRYIPHRMKKDYVQPRHFEEDMLTEAYLDVIKGPWNVRVGKQIVIWGQLDVDRVADVVNPLDFRFGVPGIDAWEEVKAGLWMIRGFYQTELPGNLLIEGIFNPGYFREFKLPYTGTHWGPAYDEPFGAEGIDIFSWQQEKFHRDANTWSLSKNYEWGFRIRGYTWGFDWTLLYWNALSDAPIANPRRITPFSLQYVFSAIGAAGRGSKINPGDWPDYKVFYYKRMQTFGGTAQTYVSWLHGSIWKLEWFYNKGQPFNRGGRGDSADIDDWCRRDTYGVAIAYSDKWPIPGIYNGIGRGKMLDLTVTVAWDKIRNDDPSLTKSALNHRPGDSTTESISVFFMQMLFNAEWVFTFIGSYRPRADKGFVCPSITYSFPGSGWYADFGYMNYFARRGYTQGIYRDKDSILFRVRREF